MRCRKEESEEIEGIEGVETKLLASSGWHFPNVNECLFLESVILGSLGFSRG